MADDTLSIRANTVGATGMRYHELALQRWLYGTFFVRAGYPIPVVFTSPMDAFGNFTTLWKSDKNPFKYLLDLKDENGTPLYEPYPSNVRYPLISVFRRNWRYRPEQSYGYHQFRHMNWPTVSDDPLRGDLANVSVSLRPNAWDYRFQIDHYCMRTDSQAYFTERLMRAFGTGGGTSQSWITVHYPALGLQRVRMYIDGNIDNDTPEEPEEQKHVEFRTTFNLVIEGYSIDQDVQIVPALWTLILRNKRESASPNEIQSAFDQQTAIDLRIGDNNSVLNSRDNVPSDEPTQQALNTQGTYPAVYLYQSGSEQPAAYLNFGFSSTASTSPYFIGGIAQTSGFGAATVIKS